MTAEDILNDLERIDHGDRELFAQFETMRRKTIAKGLPYIEVAKSKTDQSIRYLLKEHPDGAVEITDLNTNDTFTYCDDKASPRSKRQIQEDQIQRWIHGNK